MYRILICADDALTRFLRDSLPGKDWEVNVCAPDILSGTAAAIRPDFLYLGTDGARHGLAKHLLSVYKSGLHPFVFLAFFPASSGADADQTAWYATTHRVREDTRENAACAGLLHLTRAFGKGFTLRPFTAFNDSLKDPERSAAAVEIIEGVSRGTFRALRQKYDLDLRDNGMYLMLIARPVRDYYNDFTDNRDVYLLLRHIARHQVLQILSSANGGEYIRINIKTDCILLNDYSAGPLAGHTPKIIRLAQELYNVTGDGLSAHFFSARITDCTGINAAFRELMRIKNYKLFFPDKNIMVSADLRGRKESSSYPVLRGYLERIRSFSADTPDSEIEAAIRGLFGGYLTKSRSLTEYYFTCSSLNMIFDEFCRRYDCAPEDFSLPVEYQWWNGIRAVADSYIACYEGALRRIGALRRYGSGVRKVIRHIETHCKEHLSLPDLAKLAGWQPSYLSARFKAETGMTVSAFITGCRIEKAKTLLRGSTMNITEIAEEAGYHDIKYFSRVFTKTTGQTPSAFRNRPD